MTLFSLLTLLLKGPWLCWSSEYQLKGGEAVKNPRSYLSGLCLVVALVFSSEGALAQSQSGVELSLPGVPADQVVRMPEGSQALEEDEKCIRKQFRRVKKLTKVEIQCIGSAQYEGAGYLAVTNWLISEENPGAYQLVRVIGKQATPLGDIAFSGSNAWAQITENAGNIEVLSVSLEEAYNPATGWPFLRYRLEGDSLQLIPTGMFTTATNPINISREQYRVAIAEFRKKQAEELAAKQAEEAALEARYNERVAATQGFSTSYSRMGISLGHNFAIKGRTGCYTLPRLVEKLNRVVNEMEVFNNSQFLYRKGCRFIPLEDPDTYQKVGWYNNGRFFISVVFIRTRNGEEFWKPVEVIPTRLAANTPCFRTFLQRSEGGVTVRMYGRNDAGLIRGCMNDYPWLGQQLG